METIGFDGQTTMCSARGQRVQNAGARAGSLCAGEADGAHRHVVAEADEVVLKRHLGTGRPELRRRRQGHAGSHRIVGDREKAHVDLPAGGDTRRDLGEGGPARSRSVRKRWVARSRSPRRNQLSPPAWPAPP